MKKIAMVLVAGVLLVTSCKDSRKAQWDALGKRHQVTLYSGTGKFMGRWISTGNVSNEAQSDGWFFMDEKTMRLRELSGGIIDIQVEPFDTDTLGTNLTKK